MKKAAKIIVQGTVQGIFFRQFTQDHAKDLKLKGFVRNLSEGDVEIIVEGEESQIKRLENLVREGPKHSQIRNVLTEERKWTGEFDDFKILRF